MWPMGFLGKTDGEGGGGFEGAYGVRRGQGCRGGGQMNMVSINSIGSN
jgi:hypothetical protein